MSLKEIFILIMMFIDYKIALRQDLVKIHIVGKEIRM